MYWYFLRVNKIYDIGNYNRFNSWIKIFCKSIGITVKMFEKSIGASNGYVANTTKGIGNERLQKIIETYSNLNPEWLLTGKGEMLRDGLPASVSYETGHGTPYYAVDFIAGFDLVFNDQKAVPDGYIYVPQFRNADYFVDVTGDSMSPLICNGDIVALKRVGDWKDNILGGEIYAIVTNQYRTIKKVRMVKGDDTRLSLVPLNAKYDTVTVSKRSIVALFQVLGAIKKIG